MGTETPLYKGFRYPGEIISYCVWLSTQMGATCHTGHRRGAYRPRAWPCRRHLLSRAMGGL